MVFTNNKCIRQKWFPFTEIQVIWNFFHACQYVIYKCCKGPSGLAISGIQYYLVSSCCLYCDWWLVWKQTQFCLCAECVAVVQMDSCADPDHSLEAYKWSNVTSLSHDCACTQCINSFIFGYFVSDGSLSKLEWLGKEIMVTSLYPFEHRGCHMTSLYFSLAHWPLLHMRRRCAIDTCPWNGLISSGHPGIKVERHSAQWCWCKNL